MEHDENDLIHDDHKASIPPSYCLKNIADLLNFQAAFVFGQDDETERPSRPAKRRKLTKKTTASMNPKLAAHSRFSAEFVPLLNGAEKPEFVSLRQKLFVDAWSAIDARIQVRFQPAETSHRHCVSKEHMNLTKIPLECPQGIKPHHPERRRVVCARGAGGRAH